MVKNKFTKIKKRDGRIVDFKQEKITDAIFKALTATNEGGRGIANRLSNRAVSLLNKRYKKDYIPSVEEIQDIVEEVLIVKDYSETARAYILYREQRRSIREIQQATNQSLDMINNYVEEIDWQVKENSNMTFSLQGMHDYVSSFVTKIYWLNKIYPKEIREAVNSGDFHIHDLGYLATYCCGWDLTDLLMKGFRGVYGKVETAPAKHFRVALGQIVNYFYTLQGETAGAQAFSNFDTMLAPFIRYDGLDYKEVKQSMQEFIYNCNVPTRTGFQTPFTNITMDLVVPENLLDVPVIVGGRAQKETYKEFQKEMNMLNQAFAEVMSEGDVSDRVFTFPIPTYNITKDFKWDNPVLGPIWQMTAKYGIPYFANFINSEMKPEDVRSMCCRLRLSHKELYKRGGGLFGAAPLTGSIGVVTINMPRIGYLSKTKKEFLDRVKVLMDLAKESLEIKRKTIEGFTEKGLYPYAKFYLSEVKKMRGSYWGNHFSTIGLIGTNEALLNFMKKDIASSEGKKFAEQILNFMRERLIKYQEETGNMYNLEATPGEGTSYRLARMDKQQYPNIITAGNGEPYYTNSTHLPVDYTNDLFLALKLQDNIQTKYTGGCIEKGNKVLSDKGLLNIEYIVENFKKLRPIKALSYNRESEISEWDEIVEAVTIDVKKHDKIRIRGERNLDITTSDWHPFFVLERFKPNPTCPVCEEKIKDIKAFAAHIKWNQQCREIYQDFPKYRVVEKRADELKVGDYILQNSHNLYREKSSELNEDLMWMIGFYIGDGCISKFIDNRGGNNLKRYKIRFFSEHQRALDKMVKILNEYFYCEVKVIRNEKRSRLLKEISTSKKEVSEFFFKYGFQSGEKSYKIFVPQKIKENLTKTNVFSFLAGLMDSDGHISKRDGDFEYYTVSSRLADDILEICNITGIMLSKSLKKVKRKNEVDIWRLRIPQYELTKIKEKLNPTVNYSRIKEEFSDRKKRHLPVVRVKKISKIKIRDNQFYDLMTKKNHNYLAGKDCLVFVHNTVLHGFIGEKISNPETVKNLVKKVFTKFHLPYFTITPTFSICPHHGYIAGEHFICPRCTIEQPCEVYSRVVGYLRPVQQWNKGKQEEYKDRLEYKIKA